jgi:hypothetical protein
MIFAAVTPCASSKRANISAVIGFAVDLMMISAMRPSPKMMRLMARRLILVPISAIPAMVAPISTISASISAIPASNALTCPRAP